MDVDRTILAISKHSEYYRYLELGRGKNTAEAFSQAQRIIAAWGPLMRAQDAVAQQRELLENLRYVTWEEAVAMGVTMMDSATERVLERCDKNDFYRSITARDREEPGALRMEVKDPEPSAEALEEIDREYHFRFRIGYWSFAEGEVTQ